MYEHRYGLFVISEKFLDLKNILNVQGLFIIKCIVYYDLLYTFVGIMLLHNPYF